MNMNRDFKMNSVIRSYDFPSLDSEYMEGVITGTDSQGRYACNMTKRVQDGVEIDFPKGEQFFTMPLGRDTFDGIREKLGRESRLVVLS